MMLKERREENGLEGSDNSDGHSKSDLLHASLSLSSRINNIALDHLHTTSYNSYNSSCLFHTVSKIMLSCIIK